MFTICWKIYNPMPRGFRSPHKAIVMQQAVPEPPTKLEWFYVLGHHTLHSSFLSLDDNTIGKNMIHNDQSPFYQVTLQLFSECGYVCAQECVMKAMIFLLSVESIPQASSHTTNPMYSLSWSAMNLKLRYLADPKHSFPIPPTVTASRHAPIPSHWLKPLSSINIWIKSICLQEQSLWPDSSLSSSYPNVHTLPCFVISLFACLFVMPVSAKSGFSHL